MRGWGWHMNNRDFHGTHTTYAQIVRPKFTLNDHSMFSSIKLDEAKSCRVGQRKALWTNTNTMEPAAMQTFSR